MNVFKKIISIVIVSAMLLAGTAIPVSADYDPCDINRDGYVGAADVVYVTRYLLGSYSISNYNQLDANRSLVVDEADKECVISKVLGNTYSSGYFSRKTGNVVSPPTVSGFTPSESSSRTTPRTYMRCRYDNDGQPTALSSYTLTPTIMDLNDGASPRGGIIGNDDRKLFDGPETSGLVYLGGATGFIIGDHQIATAAHCVYDKKYNNEWISMKIRTYDSNGCITDTYLHPVEAHFPLSYCITNNDMYDYALITVSEDLSDRVHFSLGTPYNVSKSAYSNIPIYVTGGPMAVLGENNETVRNYGYNLYSAEGKIVDLVDLSLNSNTDTIYYDVDVTEGNSGGPIYTITKIGSKYVYTAISIVSSEAYPDPDSPNAGPMITHYQLQFYNNNPNASYSAN